VIKKKDIVLHNTDLKEVFGGTDAGQYDVPTFGKTPKGRKNPLKIDGEKSVKSSRAVKDKKFPKWGGPGGVFIKIKDKCKKFPYCNQGDINSIEMLKETIEETSKKYGIPKKEIENIVLNEIKEIFIEYETKNKRH
jgi:Fe-S cluster assembly scaffold protein SufB